MLLQMGLLLRLGPNVITDGTFITLGSKSYYRWDLYYAWVHLLHLCLLQASNNEAQKIFDRITAIRYRVMATVLESVVETVEAGGDMSPSSLKTALNNALPECEECLHKLHSPPAVQDNFKVELGGGVLNVRSRYGKDERRKIISTVCQVNRAIYNATRAVGRDALVWPFVDTREDKVDPFARWKNIKGTAQS